MLTLENYRSMKFHLGEGDTENWTEFLAVRKELPKEDPAVWSLMNNIWRAERIMREANTDMKELLDRRISKMEAEGEGLC